MAENKRCTIMGRGKDGELSMRCPRKAEWKWTQRRKGEAFCDKCKKAIEIIFSTNGQWEKIEGG